MVKADAYGLGMERVSRAIERVLGTDLWAFGVATVSEGERLRRSGWRRRVIVFSPTPRQEFQRAAAAGLTLCMSDLEGVREWAGVAAGIGAPLPFHTEVDTGMGRSGFPAEEAAMWGQRVARIASGSLRWEGCFTHFHSADEPDPEPTDAQWRFFREAIDRLPPDPARVIHSCNSAATLHRPGYARDRIRPGIFLYGGEVGAEARPRPVASVRARLTLVREMPAGSTVGYGATYVARRPERWGTLAIGYGDGLRRSLATGGGEALVNGRRVPIIGRISMDMTTVDLSGVPGARPGDVATLIGREGDEEIPLDRVAERCGTISYEILTGLSPRLPRVYLHDGDGARAEDTSFFSSTERCDAF